MEQRESPGVMGAAFQAGRRAVRRHRLLDEVLDSLARLFVQVGFGE